MKRRVIWHLPFAMVGGVETSYATILKYFNKDKFELFVTCHIAIQAWTEEKMGKYALILPFSTSSDLAKAIYTVSPDVIMGTHGKALYEALSELDRPQKVIEIVHGSHIWSEHNVFMPKDWTRHVVCVSNSAQRVYEKNLTSDISTSVIINGVDTELFYPMKPLALVPKIVGYMGRFMECDKHIKKILASFKSLHNFQARLHLIGGSPVEIVALKHFARSLKIANMVRFYPHTTTPEKHFKSIDIFTVRSEAEGYCNSAAEALATGTPCVCYNFGGILEHVPAGTFAVASTQQEYTSLLLEVSRNFELRKSMRQKGLEFIRHEGSANIMVNRYEELIEKVCLSKSLSVEFTPQKLPDAQPSKPLSTVIAEVPITITHKNPIVGLCNLSWTGIATATKNVCDVIVNWHADPKVMVRKLIQRNPRAILISGMCPGFDRVITLLNRQHTSIPVYAYYHGGLSHYSFISGIFGQAEYDAFAKLIDLYKSGKIRKIAVSSPGFAEALRDSGISAEFCGNIMEKKLSQFSPPLKGLHIGSWNRHLDHKHTSSAIAISNLAKGTLHCLQGYRELPGISSKNVRSYGEMSQEVIFDKYAQMTVNLQLSFIETFNISVLEMWACGAPVIMGCGNHVLVKGSEFLEKMCYVSDMTNPTAVAKRVQQVALNRQEVVSKQYEHLDKLNSEVRSRWNNFFL